MKCGAPPAPHLHLKEGPLGPSLLKNKAHCAFFKRKGQMAFFFSIFRRGSASSSYFSHKNFYRKSLIYEDPTV